VRDYLRSGLVKTGLGLLVLGCGPLVAIIVLAAVGLWPDPNPNPIGPGLLACLTFWPGVICLIVRSLQVASRRRAGG
jgi:hypothetical protein